MRQYPRLLNELTYLEKMNFTSSQGGTTFDIFGKTNNHLITCNYIDNYDTTYNITCMNPQYQTTQHQLHLQIQTCINITKIYYAEYYQTYSEKLYLQSFDQSRYYQQTFCSMITQHSHVQEEIFPAKSSNIEFYSGQWVHDNLSGFQLYQYNQSDPEHANFPSNEQNGYRFTPIIYRLNQTLTAYDISIKSLIQTMINPINQYYFGF
jgi:hypothetical protein